MEYDLLKQNPSNFKSRQFYNCFKQRQKVMILFKSRFKEPTDQVTNILHET